MAKAPPKPAGGLVGKAQTTLTRKVGPLPVWAWAAVGVGAWYVYKRATGPAPSESGAEGVSDYGATPAYDQGSYAGAYPDGGGYSDGGAGGVPSSIPLEYTGEPIPVSVSVGGGGGRPPRRHGRDPRVKKITKRIEALKQGGVTPKERQRIVKLRERRKRIRGK